ncbi:ROK family protein [Roseomonas marmotae]|uniref:ROK family protein n=1 Tax=Roseomonas marmotae TaxID=2768161 RepID=A0ABS3KGR1_9PROT|nr:ROK family protein [Roseomonas marmotae]MBO1076663.1 ROK family protein [Roseomonas marmotae]QTI79600.1 ROK family protein [Roseomonas marmotae]
MTLRIGIDLGGTKTEIVALAPDGTPRLRRRAATPDGYRPILEMLAGLVRQAESELGEGGASVGLGIPGSLSPATGLVRNANTQCLNGQPLDRDLAALLGRPVRVSNDANCLALSEAADGAGAGHGVVFAVIIGTGCGGGVVVDGRLIEGYNRVGGEWGHTPLPWMTPAEFPGPRCWCGLHGCLETFLCGPALAADWKGAGERSAHGIAAAAEAGDAAAQGALERHASRLARALAAVTNLIDPDAIVLGGGLSNLGHLYETVPGLMAPFIFGDVGRTRLLRAKHGDSSGVFGAARLWDKG